MTFVVRLTRDEVGRITGVVEEVKTGLKVRVEGLGTIGRALGEMILLPGDRPRPEPARGMRFAMTLRRIGKLNHE